MGWTYARRLEELIKISESRALTAAEKGEMKEIQAFLTAYEQKMRGPSPGIAMLAAQLANPHALPGVNRHATFNAFTAVQPEGPARQAPAGFPAYWAPPPLRYNNGAHEAANAQGAAAAPRRSGRGHVRQGSR